MTTTTDPDRTQLGAREGKHPFWWRRSLSFGNSFWLCLRELSGRLKLRQLLFSRRVAATGARSSNSDPKDREQLGLARPPLA
jgi:hypothetical protein